jgi:Zn-dependent oligopeptidase
VQHEFEVDQLKISEFFPLERTATNMIGIFASLLNLRFDSIPSEKLTRDVVWHDTVRVFSVWDTKEDAFIRYLYFDLLWRENKYRGNQSVNIQCVSVPSLFHSCWPLLMTDTGLSTARWKQTIPFDDFNVFVPNSDPY